ncbi:MAG: hypothetical protein QW367_03715 [Candidatus Aenigmatarchaeota archaeon]
MPNPESDLSSLLQRAISSSLSSGTPRVSEVISASEQLAKTLGITPPQKATDIYPQIQQEFEKVRKEYETSLELTRQRLKEETRSAYETEALPYIKDVYAMFQYLGGYTDRQLDALKEYQESWEKRLADIDRAIEEAKAQGRMNLAMEALRTKIDLMNREAAERSAYIQSMSSVFNTITSLVSSFQQMGALEEERRRARLIGNLQTLQTSIDFLKSNLMGVIQSPDFKRRGITALNPTQRSILELTSRQIADVVGAEPRSVMNMLIEFLRQPPKTGQVQLVTGDTGVLAITVDETGKLNIVPYQYPLKLPKTPSGQYSAPLF